MTATHHHHDQDDDTEFVAVKGDPSLRYRDVVVVIDAGHWIRTAVVSPSGDWQLHSVDLGDFVGEVIQVRFIFEAGVPAGAAAADVWRLENIRLHVNAPSG